MHIGKRVEIVRATVSYVVATPMLYIDREGDTSRQVEIHRSLPKRDSDDVSDALRVQNRLTYSDITVPDHEKTAPDQAREIA